MADEVERTGEENGGEQTDDRGEETARLEELVARKDEEILNISRRLDELKRVIGERDEEISALKQSAAETEEKLAAANSSLSEAVAGYRAAVAQANPEIVEELITGDSIEAVNQSLEEARKLVSRVKQELETQISLARIPAGAPERAAPDLSGLTPREKIQYAIGKK